jgi:hypothetical protein
MERTFWYEGNTPTREVYEEYACTSGAKLLPDWTPAFMFRSQSDASTSAGPSSPELDFSLGSLHCGSPPFSPARSSSVISRSRFEDSPLLKQPTEKRKDLEKIPSLQARKVFVGGVPQRVDQADLYKMFSRVAKVEKAWLQMAKEDRCVSNAKKHRGFGFVIFSDKNAVEGLLGEDTSKLITLGEDLRFDVKRAVGKFAGVARTPDPGHRPQGTLSWKKDTGSPIRQYRSGPRSASVETSPVSYGLRTSDEMPQVPPFPSVGCPHREWPSGLPKMSTSRLPPAFVQKQVIQEHMMCPPPPKILMNFLVGGSHWPQTDEQLESMLIRAMPDHYDD